MKSEYTTIQIKKELHKQIKEMAEKSDVKIRVLAGLAINAFLELNKEGE